MPEGERLIVLAPDGGAAVAACGEYAAALEAAREPAGGDGDEVVVGLSAPVGPIAAAAAYKQAEQALSVARRRGRVCVAHEQLAAGSVLPLLADDAVKAFADGLLRPLYEHDATGRGDLVASLRAWLSHHGQWGRGSGRPGGPPTHPALPDAKGGGDPRPIPGRPGRTDGTVACPEGDIGRRLQPGVKPALADFSPSGV